LEIPRDIRPFALQVEAFPYPALVIKSHQDLEILRILRGRQDGRAIFAGCNTNSAFISHRIKGLEIFVLQLRLLVVQHFPVVAGSMAHL
jgi:hypothetical protein